MCWQFLPIPILQGRTKWKICAPNGRAFARRQRTKTQRSRKRKSNYESKRCFYIYKVSHLIFKEKNEASQSSFILHSTFLTWKYEASTGFRLTNTSKPFLDAADFFKDTKAKKYQQQTAVKQHHFDIRAAIRS